MKIVVDWDLCESNAVCQKIAPRVFRINDKDQLEIVQEHLEPADLPSAEKAARMCPRGAISVVDDS